MEVLQGRKKEQIDSHLDLGWEPLDLTDEGSPVPELLQQCSWIDRTVPAVTHMRGGSQARSSPCTPQPLVAPCHAQPAAQI